VSDWRIIANRQNHNLMSMWKKEYYQMITVSIVEQEKVDKYFIKSLHSDHLLNALVLFLYCLLWFIFIKKNVIKAS
jgi:hypothetical protein